MTEPLIVPLSGVPHILEAVRIEDLPDWRAAHGLVVTGRVTLCGSEWPPILLYVKEKEDGLHGS